MVSTMPKDARFITFCLHIGLVYLRINVVVMCNVCHPFSLDNTILHQLSKILSFCFCFLLFICQWKKIQINVLPSLLLCQIVFWKIERMGGKKKKWNRIVSLHRMPYEYETKAKVMKGTCFSFWWQDWNSGIFVAVTMMEKQWWWWHNKIAAKKTHLPKYILATHIFFILKITQCTEIRCICIKDFEPTFHDS